ncbi:MAG: signal peptidase I [Clostridia bacterium]|nr:signal peptidase I [Clostridia bacterium]
MAKQPVKKSRELPTVTQLQEELAREKYKKRYRKALFSTVYSLIIVAAVAVLIATLALPVMEISGSSMEPTLNDKEIVLLIKTTKLSRGELLCFSYQNKLLIKRVIAKPGDTVKIDNMGFVSVNGETVVEPYITDRALGECDIEFPYTVPENHYFVMGDHRSTSIDSRSSVIGPVDREQIVGKIMFRIWPFDKVGFVE